MKISRILALPALIVVFGCHRTVGVTPPPPPPPLPAALLSAEDAYEQGDFARAARSYESFVDSQVAAKEMDRILFRFAVSDSLSGVSARVDSSNDILNQLVREFPMSPYAAPARMILSLRTELAKIQGDYMKLSMDKDTLQKTQNDKIKQLNDELDRLKKIDLERRR